MHAVIRCSLEINRPAVLCRGPARFVFTFSPAGKANCLLEAGVVPASFTHWRGDNRRFVLVPVNHFLGSNLLERSYADEFPEYGGCHCYRDSRAIR